MGIVDKIECGLWSFPCLSNRIHVTLMKLRFFHGETVAIDPPEFLSCFLLDCFSDVLRFDCYVVKEARATPPPPLQPSSKGQGLFSLKCGSLILTAVLLLLKPEQWPCSQDWRNCVDFNLNKHSWRQLERGGQNFLNCRPICLRDLVCWSFVSSELCLLDSHSSGGEISEICGASEFELFIAEKRNLSAGCSLFALFLNI